ncbi:MAG: nucleotidyltransferase domain-containing protein [Acidobacteria bacterium]|nr:nucleotidyltransferase domain-containing protein [Acidobacteriota bacterium]
MSFPHDILESCIRLCQEDPRLQLAFLFGSVARGEAGRESDLDLAVADADRIGWERKMELMERFSLASGRPVDLVDLRTATGPLLRAVLCRGTRLLCRDPLLLAELLRRLWYDAADFQPLVRHIRESRVLRWTTM